MADNAYYELAKIDSTTLADISRIDGVGTEVSIVDFEEGSEDLQIQAFIDDVRDMEPGAEVVDDQDADGDTDGRRIGFYRR